MSSQPHYPPPSRPPGYGRRPFPVAAVAAAVVVLILVAGVAYWLGGRNDKGSAAASTSSPAASVAPSATGGAPSATSAPSATAGAPSATSSAGAGASAPATSAGVPPTVGPPTSVSPTPVPTTSPPVNPVPDFGFLRSVVTAGGVTKLTFDRATLLSGPAAASYAKAHHTEVLDDYIIQNDNPLIRTWTVAPNAEVAGSIQLSGKVDRTPSTLDALKAFIAAHPTGYLPVDLYYDKNDAVTKIAEVYFP